MNFIDMIGQRTGLTEHYPLLAKTVPFSEMTVLYASYRLLLLAVVYQLFRWFWLTGWLIRLFERLLERLWQLFVLLLARLVEGAFTLLQRLLEELLRYRIAKLALIAGGIYMAFCGYHYLQTLFP